jgi:ABC-type nitrate/sulfonate/bicarbonate transport system substrate-binding protein
MRRCPMVTIAAGLLLLLAGGATRAAEAIKLTVASDDAIYAPYFIALDKGYFKAAGLDVELIEAGGGAATPALMSGTVQFSSSSGSAESAILKGAPLKIVMTISVTLPWKLWATGPDVKSLADLKGKPVGVQTRGDLFEVAIRAALLKAGLAQDSIIYSPMGVGSLQRVAVMQSASMPAGILSYLDERIARANGSLARGHVLVDFKDIQIPYNGLATSDALIAKSPAMIREFLKAVLMGVRYMKTYKDGSLRVLGTHNKSKLELLAGSYDESMPTIIDSGTIARTTQDSELALRRSMLGMADKSDPPAEKVFDYRLVAEARAQLDSSGWQPVE